MAEITYPSILKVGTQAKYEQLLNAEPSQISNDVLYFCTDSGKIYKGTVDFTNFVIVAGNRPETPYAGKMYMITSTGTFEVYVNGQWKVVGNPTVTTVDQDSDDQHVPTAAAVWSAIQDAVSDISSSANVVKSIAVKKDQDENPVEGTLEYVTADNEKHDVALTGVVTTPNWNETTRVLTLPVVGSNEAITVNIGKDIFVDATKENKYNPETECIELWLNDGDGTHESTKIEIPAGSLITEITGTTAQGTSTTVNENHQIVVNIVLDPDEKNALQKSDKGLIVDLSDYAKSEDLTPINQAIEGIKNAATALTERVTTAEGDITDLKNADTAINAEIANLKSADTAINAEIANLKNADTAINAEIESLKNADTAINAEIEALKNADTALEAKVDALAAATTVWGTF